MVFLFAPWYFTLECAKTLKTNTLDTLYHSKSPYCLEDSGAIDKKQQLR